MDRLDDEVRRTLGGRPRPENLKGFVSRSSRKRDADKSLVEGLNAQIEHAQKQLEVAKKAKDTFLERLRHEDEEGAFASALGVDLETLRKEAEAAEAAEVEAAKAAAPVQPGGALTPELRAFLVETITHALRQHNAPTATPPSSSDQAAAPAGAGAGGGGGGEGGSAASPTATASFAGGTVAPDSENPAAPSKGALPQDAPAAVPHPAV
jgi:hypothetical protein